jgi:anti-sigma regulatory factor (Ser/Thr protein kinase)
VLVVSELLTNAIQASPEADAMVWLELSLTGAGCRITVADGGQGFTHDPRASPRNGGRGLVVVRRLAEDVSIRCTTGWTVVSAVIPDIRPPGSAR